MSFQVPGLRHVFTSVRQISFPESVLKSIDPHPVFWEYQILISFRWSWQTGTTMLEAPEEAAGARFASRRWTDGFADPPTASVAPVRVSEIPLHRIQGGRLSPGLSRSHRVSPAGLFS